jgi:hypothetical protein
MTMRLRDQNSPATEVGLLSTKADTQREDQTRHKRPQHRMLPMPDAIHLTRRDDIWTAACEGEAAQSDSTEGALYKLVLRLHNATIDAGEVRTRARRQSSMTAPSCNVIGLAVKDGLDSETRYVVTFDSNVPCLNRGDMELIIGAGLVRRICPDTRQKTTRRRG